MRAAERWNVPVLQHSWSQTNIRQRRFHSDPADTALLARRFPQVQVIMAHLTGCGFRGVLEAKGIPNLVIDTSGGLPEANLVEYAVEHLGADHVVYGSDLPIRETATTMGRILGSEISDDAKRRILYGNAKRILKL
jgi:predicted TIM-barrel fold metal-dependent hydrolase